MRKYRFYPCKNKNCPCMICEDVVDGHPIMTPGCCFPYFISNSEDGEPEEADYKEYCWAYKPNVTPPKFSHDYYKIDEFCEWAEMYLRDAHNVSMKVTHRELSKTEIRIIFSVSPNCKKQMTNKVAASISKMIGRTPDESTDQITGYTYYFADMKVW